MNDNFEEYKHPALKYIRTNYGRDSVGGRKLSLNFNTQITYSDKQLTFSPIKTSNRNRTYSFNPNDIL